MKRIILKIFTVLMLAAVPLTLVLCAVFSVEKSALITFAAASSALIPFFLQFERKRLRPRDIMPIVVLAAVAVAGRMLFAALPNIKPVTAIVIIAGVCFGRYSGFMTGALTALVSNMFLGQGAWTPWQMYAWGLIGFFAGVFSRRKFFQKPWVVYVFGFISCLIYGLIMDSWHVVGFVRPLTLAAAVAGYAAGLPFTLLHAAATVVFYCLFTNRGKEISAEFAQNTAYSRLNYKRVRNRTLKIISA